MEQIFLRVLNMSITAGYCVLVVMVLRLLLRKMPKIYSYALWAVVYFRLVCPVSIESVHSLVRVNTQMIPMDIGVRETPRIYSGSARVDAVVNAGIQQTIPQAAIGASVNPMQVVLSVAGAAWILVAVLLIMYNVWSVFRLKRQLANAKWVELNIYEAENLQTPFVLGFFRPCIYLPAGLKGREREYVLAHEKTHIRRRDYLIKQAAFLVTCVYWYHPLIWLAFYQMCRDMEMSCDESVIRRMGGEIKKEYSASLLSLASGRQIVNGSPLAFGEGGIKARITNVLHYKRPTFWVSIFFVAALTLVLVGLALNPEEGETNYKGKEMPVEIADMYMVSGSTETADGEKGLYELEETETVETEEWADEIERVEEIDSDSFEQAMYYQGYLDESPYTFWNRDWNDCDFDGDGERDRVYRGVTGEGISYRIDFGGGGTLKIGEFEDFFTGLKLECADITGNGADEILFVGAHMACTDPFDMSEIALFEKVGDHYVRAVLPQPKSYGKQEGTSEYTVGFDIYAQREDEKTFYIECADAGLETTITLEKELDEIYLEEFGGGSMVLWGTCAYDADFIQYQGEECLILYEDLGGKWIYQPVGIVLGMELSADSRAPYGAKVVTSGIVQETGLPEYDFSKQQEVILHMHVSDYLADSIYIDTDLLPEETAKALAERALRELYELTGTQIGECYYYYDAMGCFSFALTETDMDRGRIFYSRTFGEEEHQDFVAIQSMFLSNARRVWYSPVYQYNLPEDFSSYEDSEKAVWFLKQSGVYNGKEVEKCIQPYSAMPETWQIIMEDGTAYEVSLDMETDGVSNITGPYPDKYINH